jgi:hypothetical protein
MSLCIETNSEPLQLNENFSLHILGEGKGRTIAGKAVKLVGRRLIATIAETVVEGTCVSIPCREGRLLAEVIGCWRERQTNFAAFDMVHAMCESNSAWLQRLPEHSPAHPSARNVA